MKKTRKKVRCTFCQSSPIIMQYGKKEAKEYSEHLKKHVNL